MFSKIHRDDKQIFLLSICQLIRSAVQKPQAAQHRAGLAEREQTVAHSVIYRAVGAAEAERVHARLRLRADGGDDGIGAVVRDDGALADIVVIRVGERGDIIPLGFRRVRDVQLRAGQTEPDVLEVFPSGGVEAVGVVPGGIKSIDRAVQLREVPGVRDALALMHRLAGDRAGGDACAIEKKGKGVGDAAADGAALADGGIGRLVKALRLGVGDVRREPVIDIERDGVVPHPRRGGEDLVRFGAERLILRRSVVIQPAKCDLRRRAQARGSGDVVAAEPEVIRQGHELIETGGDEIEIPAVQREILLREDGGTELLGQIGAFANIENAKKACEKGYSVYNSQGIAVYTPTQEQANTAAGLPYEVRIDISNLRIRKGPGTGFDIVKYINPGIYTIVETQGNWGRLKSGAGWICLDYTKRV